MILFELKNGLSFASAVLSPRPALRASAQETNSVPPDKSSYNLFNPVPENLMRELSPDRPDKTESPYTLDAGHFMLEMDFANFTYDKSDGTTTKAWNIAPFQYQSWAVEQC